MKNFRHLITTLIGCIVSLLLLTMSLLTHAESVVVNKVAVIVNNGVVLESEINDMIRTVKQSAKQSKQPLPNDEILRNQIIERLIIDSIILQIGQNVGVQINDQDVNSAIANIAQQNNISVNQLRNYLASDGVSYSAYQEQIRKDILINEVRQNEVGQRVHILPQEVELLAKQIATQEDQQTEYNISHILLGLPEDPTQKQVDQIEKQAKEIIQKSNKGANFAELAATYSTDSQALHGGSMGWSKISEIPTLFSSHLYNVTEGAIIGPIRSGVGFHILRINQIRQHQTPAITKTEYHARHILLKPSPIKNDAQTITELKSITTAINQHNTTFEQAAKEYSEDPGSATQGGDLGWAVADIYDPAFRTALVGLKTGQISKPVRSSFGWHIIQLLESRKVDGTESAYQQQAHRLLFNRKFNEEAQIWMQEQRAGAYVKILDKE